MSTPQRDYLGDDNSLEVGVSLKFKSDFPKTESHMYLETVYTFATLKDCKL